MSMLRLFLAGTPFPIGVPLGIVDLAADGLCTLLLLKFLKSLPALFKSSSNF